MPKLDQNAGVEVEFEEPQDETVVETEVAADPHTPPTQSPAASQSQPTALTAEEQEERDAEAAGVNTSEKQENKVRKIELKALKKDLKELGELYGRGKTSMINVAERITQAAMKKAISLSDAGNVYDLFHDAAEAKATIDDAGVVPDAALEERPQSDNAAENKKQQIRKVEQFIELGNKFDETAYDLIRRARNIHLKLLAGNRDTIMKGSTYTILVSIARTNKTRKESQGVMSDQEISDHLYVAPSPEATPADEWKKVEDALVSARAAAKGSKERQPIEAHTVAGQHLQRAIENLRSCLGEGAPQRLAAMDQADNDRQLKMDQANAKKVAKKKAA